MNLIELIISGKLNEAKQHSINRLTEIVGKRLA